MPTLLLPITRPDGRVYCPRKVIACAVGDEDGILAGVVVLGIHDVERAAKLAQDYVDWQLGEGYAPAQPECGWYRDAFEGGERRWIRDEVRGRAGVMFREIVERPWW
jgi:hypothetical protein